MPSRFTGLKQESGTHDADKERETHRIPSCEWLEVSIVRQLLPVPALCLHPGFEAQIREADPKPCHQASDSGHVREPAKDASRPTLETHVGEDREGSIEDHRDPREPLLRCLEENLWGVSSLCQAICWKRSGCTGRSDRFSS